MSPTYWKKEVIFNTRRKINEKLCEFGETLYNEVLEQWVNKNEAKNNEIS